MAEQWLIDGEQLFDFLSDQLVNENGAFSKGVNKGLNIARSAIHNVDAMKPIDPETLPIVRQLRAELAGVTAERNAAIKDIEAAMGSESTQNILKYLCSLCQNKDLNRGCTCDGKCAPKWRGAQKEK